MDYIPSHNRGRARGRSNAGTAGRRQRRCAAEPSGPVRRHPAGWGGGRDADSQSAHGGPSRMVPARQPRVTGIGRPRICFPSADAFGRVPLAVGRRWTPRHGKRGRRLKGQPTGGHAEQASKHRARDAGETADLRWQLSVKLPGPAGSLRKASSAGRPGSRPGRLGAARYQGPWVHRDPGVPRALGFLFEARMGSEVELQGGPGAFQTIRAAQRWLDRDRGSGIIAIRKLLTPPDS